MSGLLASLVLIGVAIGVSAVLAVGGLLMLFVMERLAAGPDRGSSSTAARAGR
jgi:hypothetical protein